MHPPTLAPPLSPRIVRYAVQSSDVLSQNRVNVSEEKSERVIWYKERTLTDSEIVEHIFDNANSTVLWEIHRPLRGWYIRLRSPRFPMNVFVPLIPVPSSSPYHRPGSLKFSCRTNLSSPKSPPLARAGSIRPPLSPRLPGASNHSATDSEVTLTDVSPTGQFSPTHTYPPAPTPPCAVVLPPSPSVVHAKLNQLAQPRLAISQFMLASHTHAGATPASEGLFSRALRALRNNAPTSTNSFSLCPLPDGPPPTPVNEGHARHDLEGSQARSGPAPLLTFEDITPMFSVSSSTGVFEVHLDEIEKHGVDLAFWIAIALAYCEFLGDREGYLAAVAD